MASRSAARSPTVGLWICGSACWSGRPGGLQVVATRPWLGLRASHCLLGKAFSEQVCLMVLSKHAFGFVVWMVHGIRQARLPLNPCKVLALMCDATLFSYIRMPLVIVCCH